MARLRRVRTTDSRHECPIAANLLERNFIAAAPRRTGLADITYVETDQGWLYLATVMDLYSRKIVGWAMADRLRAELPLAALAMAIATQRPGAGLIHHSDRGVQYASPLRVAAKIRVVMLPLNSGGARSCSVTS